MIYEIQPSNPVNAISQEIDADIQKALALLDSVKKQDGKATTKRLEQLLIEYILANMKGDSTEVKAIQDQIANLLQKYGKDIHHADEIEAKLKAMEKNPGNSSEELAYLQSLIAALQADETSGDLSNLYR